MESYKFKILITESKNYNIDAINLYRTFGEVIELNIESELDLENNFDADVLVIRLGILFSEKLLSKFLNLKFIISPTTGLNHLDLEFFKKSDIKIISLKGEFDFLKSITSTAELTWLLLLASQRNLINAIKDVEIGKWRRDLFIGNSLQGQTIGILGMGRVGNQIAKFAHSFNMNIQCFDPYKNNVPSFVRAVDTCEILFETSDIVTIHIPYNNKNYKYVNSKMISKLKNSATLINTSRGEIWEEDAVCNAVINKNIKVATDVLNNELSVELINNPLFKLSNLGYPIIITPHIGGATFDSMSKTEFFVAEKFYNLLINNS
jgi:D-3-phosphoglycerate dehydrogenase